MTVLTTRRAEGEEGSLRIKREHLGVTNGWEGVSRGKPVTLVTVETKLEMGQINYKPTNKLGPMYDNLDAAYRQFGCDVPGPKMLRGLQPPQNCIHVAERESTDKQVSLFA